MKFFKKRFLASLFLVGVSISIVSGTTIGIVNSMEHHKDFSKKTVMSNVSTQDYETMNAINIINNYLNSNQRVFNIKSALKYKPVLPYHLRKFNHNSLANLINPDSTINSKVFYNTHLNITNSDLWADVVNDTLYNTDGTAQIQLSCRIKGYWFNFGFIKLTGLATPNEYLENVLSFSFNKNELVVPKDLQWGIADVTKWCYNWHDWGVIEYVLTNTIYYYLSQHSWFQDQIFSVNPNKYYFFNDTHTYMSKWNCFINEGYNYSIGRTSSEKYLWTYTSGIRILNHDDWEKGSSWFKVAVNIYLPKINQWIQIDNIQIRWHNTEYDLTIDNILNEVFDGIWDVAGEAIGNIFK